MMLHFAFSVMFSCVYLQSIGGESSRMVMEHISDVLFYLSKHYLDQMKLWSQDFVTKDGYPSLRCTADDKDRFIKSVLRYSNLSHSCCNVSVINQWYKIYNQSDSDYI